MIKIMLRQKFLEIRFLTDLDYIWCMFQILFNETCEELEKFDFECD